MARPGRPGRQNGVAAAGGRGVQHGKYVQGFPEYGPERMGAPITAYNRISDTRCSIHCNIDCPDYVVVVDETLLDTVDVTEGRVPDGAVIVRTRAKSPGRFGASSGIGRGRCAP